MSGRRIISVLSLSFLATVLFAAPVKNYNDLIDLRIDRFDGIYAKGETVSVEAVVDKSLEGENLVLEVFENCKSVSKTKIPAVSGTVFSASYDRSVSVMVSLAPEKAVKSDTRIGFIVSPQDFQPGYGCPKDFRKFWKKQVKALRAVPMEVKCEPVKPVGIARSQEGKYDVFSVEINSIDDTPCRGYMAKPKNAEPKSLPIIIHLHGAGVASPGSRSNIRTAVSFASRGNGCIAMDLNAHGMENGREQAYYDSLQNGPLKDYPGRKVVDHESFYFRTMFLRIVRTLDYLTQDPCWNGKILAYGSSQGGAQSAAIAALDKRVGAAVLIVPAMHDMCGSLAGHGDAWLKNRSDNGPESADILKYYDGANFLRFFKGKLHVETGLVDTTCPPANVFSAYNNAAASEKHIYTFPYRPHSEPGPRYYQSWKEGVESVRNKFMNDFLTQ